FSQGTPILSAYIETNKTSWKIYSLNRRNNTSTLLAKGIIQNVTEYDLPGISLNENNLVYNDNAQDVSKIVLVNLTDSQQKEIFGLTNGAIIGKPVIDNDIIVWSKADSSKNSNQMA
ncbi:MAG: hypothetical protein GX434_13125, partial [Peptococcaceae bacterium]|nr:hypothetical protein [Peptococcaceae bacterium]